MAAEARPDATMTKTRFAFLAMALAFGLVAVTARAQLKVLPEQGGRIGLGLMLRHLTNAGIYMETTAHPDDENSGLHAMLNRGRGYRTTLATATRGTGGQNEIGPELGESLAVLRTEELAAVHRWDGTEQYFARAIDFGYSFSLEETFEKWGKDAILGDYVRLIRMIRPDVISAMRPDGEGGGQHHQASARITGEAYTAAADPSRYPEQITQGLRPWQAKKLYYNLGFGARSAAPGVKAVAVNTDVYDPLLGQTYAEIGSEARANHKCQGMGQLFVLPGPSIMQYRLADTTIPGEADKTETSLFDGIDSSLVGLAQFVKGPAPEPLRTGLAAIAREVDRAQRTYDTQSVAAVEAPLLAGLAAVRALLGQLGSIGIGEDAAYEIGLRLQTKEHEFEQAAMLAHGLRVDVLADDGLVVAGQPVKVTVIVANRGASAIDIKRIALDGFDGDAGCKPGTIAASAVYRCEATVRVPGDARLTTPYWKPVPGAERYEYEPDAPFGAPFRPTPFQATVDLELAGSAVMLVSPVQYRYEGNIFSGEKRMELQVVPRFSVRPVPDIAIIPIGAARDAKAGREIRVTVTSGAKGPSSGIAQLVLPAGWNAQPASAPVEFAREDEAQTIRFTVTPPPSVKPGGYQVRAVVSESGRAYGDGYLVIEYPHINRRQRIVPAETTVKVVDVKVAPGLRVGYIMGVGDQVPPAIQQLGVQLDLLDSDTLAWGDLSRYDAIVTGVRAYERRADLRANNQRLLDYVKAGGTLIVQYNKFEFNEAQYGPLPAKVSSNRVTDENAPVQVLVPDDPVFNYPNRIGDAAWAGWVQERGLYFLGEKDPAYIDLVQLEDPFPYNKGMKRGALVEAKYGKGRWIYVGLGLWRQLPAGTDGAYALLANLLSVSKAGAAPAPPKPVR
jgi:LmbE family N-acetylglucosaminyl deacetylase